MYNFSYIGTMLELLSEGFVAPCEVVRVCPAFKILNQVFFTKLRSNVPQLSSFVL